MKDHQFETLLALMKENKEDSNKQFEGVKKQFEGVNANKKFEDVNRRFDEVFENFRDIKRNFRGDENKLHKGYNAADPITVTVTQSGIMPFLFVGFVVSSTSLAFALIYLKY